MASIWIVVHGEQREPEVFFNESEASTFAAKEGIYSQVSGPWEEEIDDPDEDDGWDLIEFRCKDDGTIFYVEDGNLDEQEKLSCPKCRKKSTIEKTGYLVNGEHTKAPQSV